MLKVCAAALIFNNINSNIIELLVATASEQLSLENNLERD